MDSKYILRNSLNKVIISSDVANSDMIKVSTSVLSSNGDVYEVDTRLLTPSLVQTSREVAELNPEVSTSYPYKVIVDRDSSGVVQLYVPDIDIPVTASQNYYVPLYYERYSVPILRVLDRQFTELSLGDS
jgi:hypothetical protein